jgi:hypothetical protein
MTSMSRSGGRSGLADLRMSMRSLVSGAMARLLLCCSMGMYGAACLIPPDLEPAGADAGPSSPPIIVAAQPPELALPGPIVLDRADQRALALEVDDLDLADTLYVRLYVDYKRIPPLFEATPFLAECQAAPSGAAARIIDCPTNSLCTLIPDPDPGGHVLEAMVSDRAFISDADPQAEGQEPFRAVADPTRAAHTISAWIMSCNTAL